MKQKKVPELSKRAFYKELEKQCLELNINFKDINKKVAYEYYKENFKHIKQPDN